MRTEQDNLERRIGRLDPHEELNIPNYHTRRKIAKYSIASVLGSFLVGVGTGIYLSYGERTGNSISDVSMLLGTIILPSLFGGLAGNGLGHAINYRDPSLLAMSGIAINLGIVIPGLIIGKSISRYFGGY